MRSTTRSLLRYPALAALVIFCAATPQRASAALVTYFNFNDSNFVSDGGQQGSTITDNNLTASFVPSANSLNLNVAAGDMTGPGSALRLTDTNNGGGNAKTFQFTVSTTGLVNLSLSYATQASTSFTQTLFYSIDGGKTFVLVGTAPNPNLTSGFVTESFNLSTAVNNQASVIFQVAMTQNGQLQGQWNDFDNIQLNADVAVPEPGTIAGGTLALAALGYMQRRRLRSAFRTRWKKTA